MATRPPRACRFLLAILIVLLISFPALEDMARPILLISIVAGAFLAGVIVVEPGRKRVQTAVTLAVAQIVLTGLAVTLTENSLPYLCAVGLGLATTALLIVYCICCVLRYVLLSSYITHDQIYAGICVYLMLGFAFGCTYYLLGLLDQNCFSVNNARLASVRGPDLMYFSFVTLATLGYGDITPVSKSARVLAELEALAGMIYIAVFMARLVSMYSAERGAGQAARPGRLDQR